MHDHPSAALRSSARKQRPVQSFCVPTFIRRRHQTSCPNDFRLASSKKGLGFQMHAHLGPPFSSARYETLCGVLVVSHRNYARFRFPDKDTCRRRYCVQHPLHFDSNETSDISVLAPAWSLLASTLQTWQRLRETDSHAPVCLLGLLDASL